VRMFNRELVWKVGDGMGTLFWKDTWGLECSAYGHFSAVILHSKYSRGEGGECCGNPP
jgi:hypothetical protein